MKVFRYDCTYYYIIISWSCYEFEAMIFNDLVVSVTSQLLLLTKRMILLAVLVEVLVVVG